jgi:hypothetical protein
VDTVLLILGVIAFAIAAVLFVATALLMLAAVLYFVARAYVKAMQRFTE